MAPEVHRKNPCDIVKNFAIVMCAFIKRVDCNTLVQM